MTTTNQWTISYDQFDKAYVITYPVGQYGTNYVSTGMQNKRNNMVKLFKTVDAAKAFVAKNYPQQVDNLKVQA